MKWWENPKDPDAGKLTVEKFEELERFIRENHVWEIKPVENGNKHATS